MLALIFHAAVRHVRKSHGNAVLGLLLNILQTALMIAVFYVMMSVIGTRSTPLRGDFVLYVMSGIFMFMTHAKAMAAVVAADGPTSPMMLHAPMNTVIAIASAALSTLYLQVLSLVIVLYAYHAAFGPITIYEPVEAFGMFLISWAAGVAIGMMFRAAKPWAPELVTLISSVYIRANMIASGKMFLANMMPGYLLAWFSWNPLFHTIDQGRGFIFMNYHPHYSSVTYPLVVTAVCVVIGLMGDFYTRKHMSISWGAKR